MADRGRPKGKDRLFREALRAQIDAAGDDMKKLRKVADALLEKAASGDVAAIREVADRIDGKVATQLAGVDEGPIQVEHSGGFDLSKLNEDELRQLEAIAERLFNESAYDDAAE